MKIETIIHYNSQNKENDLYQTLKNMYENQCIPDVIKLCLNPPFPRELADYYSFNKLVGSIFNDHNIQCHVQVLTYQFQRIEDVINQTADLSKCDHYIFVNAGYRFENNEIFEQIRKNTVIFSDGVDDQWNEFSCKTKLHKDLGGFGKHHSLVEKIEYKLKMLEEARNAAAKLAEGGSDNL